MKKTLLLALAAVATIFTSCSSDINNDNDDLNNGQSKGMTLIANVEQPDTRATLDTKETFGTWNFAYTDNDQVSVGNDKIDNYYTFTKSGENFSCADAKATSTAANWYAYYPSTNINLTNQEGTEASAAQLYALAGATETATTGSDGLTINMAPKAAVLRIVKVDNYGPCDIFLKTTGDKFVKGLKAKKNEAGYEVETSESQVSVFKKESKGNAGIYYVIVPAEVYLEVWNNTKLIKKTKTNGLKAGKYYTLTSGPTTGTAVATINGTPKAINWVQLYIGGPRFATENVANGLSWYDATKKGDDYVWGAKWHTPSKADLDFVDEKTFKPKFVEIELTTDNGVKHFKYKGTQPGYKSNEMIVPFTGKNNNEAGVYWTSTEGKINTDNQPTGKVYNITDYGVGVLYNFFTDFERHGLNAVRPVLSQETVLWGEQYIQ
ncbi:MAG: hypothetical protein JTJ26_11715 [Prevotella sp.]|nr:hypothetical protein [Prevotella sp.]